MNTLISAKVIKDSGIQFGTSGARGLVEQFSNDVCAAFTHAFISSIQSQFAFKQVAIAIDNRPSSPAMALACAKAIEQLGLEVIYYGVVPTPALAYVSMIDNIPSIMVTGSHIPFDRNGLKFYRPDGEISKADELAILNSTAEFEVIADLPSLIVSDKAASQYIERYTSLFDNQMLKGKRIGIYEHSSAGRDLYEPIFEALGAEVIALERSDKFVPIDTEAVSDSDKQKAKNWSKEYKLDFIFSTDGDGDRPLVADENGDWLRGDILGLLCAKGLGIEAIAIPINCNTATECCNYFSKIIRTKIGSPYVINEFRVLLNDFESVAGFEANGGFILGSNLSINNKVLKALPTRDAVLPFLVILSLAINKPISVLVNSLPCRYTSSDRIQNFPINKSLAILEMLNENPINYLNNIGLVNASVGSVNKMDGLRVYLLSGDIIHFRPSGNAPELRIYIESSSQHKANFLLSKIILGIKNHQ